MYLVDAPKRFEPRCKTWLNLFLVVAVLLFLGHESQHDLQSYVEGGEAKCEICLNAGGPVGIASSQQYAFSIAHEFFKRQPQNLAAPHSFHGFSYTSRAPPVV